MSAVFRHTVDVIRGVREKDRYNNDVTRWANAPETPDRGWAVDVGDTSSDRDGREGVVVTYTLRKRGPKAEILPTDRIRLFGEVFTIQGDVVYQPGPSRMTSHTILRLKRSEG